MEVHGDLAIRTDADGRRLIANRPFRAGEVIRTIPREDVRGRPNRFTVQIGHGEHTTVGVLAALNHSCEPNLILDTAHLSVLACRDVASGEELTYFYPSTEWEMDVPFICRCGSKRCIHVVAGARFLPIATLERYFLNEHIRAEIIGRLTRTDKNLPRESNGRLSDDRTNRHASFRDVW
jgi:hypothetical protein